VCRRTPAERHEGLPRRGPAWIVEGRRYRHDERGIRALCARLIALAVELVAVERPDRLPIERLLDQGLSVIAI
jgi:hypothetical protein